MESVVRQVDIATERELGDVLGDAVRQAHPVVLLGQTAGEGVLLSREAILRLLSPYRFHVDVIPEDEGGFTLWFRELNLASTGPTLKDARQRLLAMSRAYCQDYFDHFVADRTVPELAAQEPYVLRLSLAHDDRERLAMLFGQSAPMVQLPHGHGWRVSRTSGRA